MPARKRTAKAPKPRNPIAKALRVLKPKTVETRRAYKRKPKHAAAAPEDVLRAEGGSRSTPSPREAGSGCRARARRVRGSHGSDLLMA
jgi:hypothetical protein